jgi:hypothetical protein
MFADQVGHRVPMTLLLLYLDYTYFAGHMHLLVVASLACAWIASGVFYVAFRAESAAPSPVDRAAYAFCVFAVFWAGSGFDFVWGANQGSQQTVALLAISFTALAVYQNRRRANPTAGGAALPALAVVAAFLATFSHGMGAATWAGLGFASIVARVRLRVFAAFLVAGVGSIVLYGWGLKHVPYGSFWVYLKFLRKTTLAIGKFWLAFIGNPVAQSAGGFGDLARAQYFTIGMIGGAIGIAVFVPYALYLWRRRVRPGAIETLCVALMAFSIGGGLLVAVNRFMFPANAVSDRFLSWTALFWIGAVVALVRLARERAWGGWLALAVFGTLALATVPALQRAHSVQDRVRQKLAREAAMHLSGVRWDPLARMGINPKSEPVYRVAQRLRRERRGFFADGRGELPGTRLAERFGVEPAQRCGGKVERVEQVPARDGPAAMVSGTVSHRDGERFPSFLLITDAAGIIRGVGEIMPGKASAAGAEAVWVGFVGDFDPAQRYTAHGVLAGGRAACSVASFSGPIGKGR